MKRLLLALMAAGLMTVGLGADTAQARGRGRVVIRGGFGPYRGVYRSNRGYRGRNFYRGYRGYYGYPRYRSYYGYGYGYPRYYGYGYPRYYNYGYGYPYGGGGIYFRF